MIVNENGTANISGRIDSNPLSNASWYKGEQLLKNQSLVNTTFLIIERAKCTDTKNYTLVVRNILEVNVTSEVELFVNCEFTLHYLHNLSIVCWNHFHVS